MQIHRGFGALPLVFVLAVFSGAPAYGEGINGMQVVGYADRLSVQPGETIRFMVSSELPRYRAEIVRLIHGDPNPKGPGIKEELVATAANGEYPGRHQEIPVGSYVIVPDNPALHMAGSFTLQAWIAPTTPQRGVQGILTKWSGPDQLGYGLFIDEDGSLALWLGDENGNVEKVRSGRALRPWVPSIPGAYPSSPRPQMVNSAWYFVAATYEAASGKVALYQEPLNNWAVDPSRVVSEQTTTMRAVGQNDVPFLMAGYWVWREAETSKVGGFFNGKIDSPRLFGRALRREEIEELRKGGAPGSPVAAWEFSADISSRKVSDMSSNRLHGETVQMPMRAVTGHNWTGRELNFNHAREQYGAIYFHDDDLDDAGWEVGFELKVPDQFKSGVYAARLRAGNGEDYVPFFVRPKRGTATAEIALLIPTFSYLAYANPRWDFPNNRYLLGTYSYHSDGSGVCYSSHLRPILNLRPKLSTRDPWQFMADLHLVDWLEVKGFPYDVITEHDLHFEGADLLAPYNVVISGTHPEYFSEQMLDGLKTYLEEGGRHMYMGGNGYYWVTSIDPERRQTIEIRRRDGTEAWQGAPGEHYHSTTGEAGGLWRFRGRPPQELVGVGFTAQGFDRSAPFRRQPGSFDPRASFIFEGVGPDELIGNFPSLVLEFGAAGSELDRVDPALGSPAHTLILATASGQFSDAYQHVVEEVNTSDSKQGGTVNPLVKADMVFLEYPNGGAVFSTSSIAWCGSLSYNGYDNNVSRITENVLTRFAADGPLPGPEPVKRD